ncbi:hypothetical protein DFH09DRAFT_1367664 [Mycena vulgaris]|nr:hypothetical protein DFH09DRAFT_1367664 [Mycena vulgaris]
MLLVSFFLSALLPNQPLSIAGDSCDTPVYTDSDAAHGPLCSAGGQGAAPRQLSSIHDASSSHDPLFDVIAQRRDALGHPRPYSSFTDPPPCTRAPSTLPRTMCFPPSSRTFCPRSVARPYRFPCSTPSSRAYAPRPSRRFRARAARYRVL